MLTTKRTLSFILILFLLLGLSNVSFAQDEDDMFDDEETVEQEDVVCIPESLLTGWDENLSKDSTVFDPAKVNTYLSFANDYFIKKNYASATPYLWKVLVGHKESKWKVWALKKLIDCYFETGKDLKGEQAVAYLDSALIVTYRGLEIDENDHRFHYWAGFIQKMLKRYSCALPHYERLVEFENTNKGYWISLAQIYFKLDDDKCIQAQQKVVQIDPDDAEARQMLENYVRSRGGSLIKVLEKNFNDDPNNPEYCEKYGIACNKEGMYVKAINAFKQLLKLDPNSAVAFKNLGEAYYGVQNNNQAIANYKAYLAKVPDGIDVMIKLGNIYKEKQDFQSAIAYAYKALNIKSGYGESYILIAETYIEGVSYCSSRREKAGINYDDKLVYKRAYNMASKALNDPASSSRARGLTRSLKPSLPTKEDEFLYGNRQNIKDSCYSWVK